MLEFGIPRNFQRIACDNSFVRDGVDIQKCRSGLFHSVHVIVDQDK